MINTIGIITFKFNFLGDFYSLKKYNQSVGVSLEYTDLDSTDDGKHFQFKGTVKETSTFNFCDLFSLVIPLPISDSVTV